MTEVLETAVAIVGAGPAGLAAARALRQAGVSFRILDEAPSAGGQIYRSLPAEFVGGLPARFVPPSHAAGEVLLAELRDEDVLGGTTVFDADTRELHCERGRRALLVRFERLLLATGAYDRSLPFPGWTLPGVVTPGAAQVLVRGQGLKPGDRAVVAGTGPLLLPTVTALLAAGVEVVGLFDANPTRSGVTALLGSMRTYGRRAEAWHYLRRLVAAGVRPQAGRVVIAAHGDQTLRRVVVAEVDAGGIPRPGTEREIPVDLLCVGYGLLPSIELAVRLGCRMRHLERRGGFVPEHGENMRSSLDAVFVAGEVAGIGGAEVARIEGELAGSAIALDLGAATPAGIGPKLASLRQRRSEARRASDALLRAFPVLPGLLQIPRDDTIVCRCEDVTLGEIARASRLFGADVRSVKLATRAGMGPCQARVCHRAVGDLLHRRLGGAEFPTPCPSIQAPVKPVAVESIFAAEDVSSRASP